MKGGGGGGGGGEATAYTWRSVEHGSLRNCYQQVLQRSATVHGYIGCDQVSVQGHVGPTLQETD